MSRRILTDNRDSPSDGSPTDPFEDGSYDDYSPSNGGSYSEAKYPYQGSSQSQQSSSPQFPQESQPYDGYLKRSSSGNAMAAPSHFDRYPHLASRDTSYSSLASHFGRTDYQKVSQNGSSNSSNQNLIDPFTPQVESSPFGGYPATQFPLHIDEKEDDDYLHNPDPIADADYDKNRFWHDIKTLDRRSGWGLAGFIILLLAAISVFVVLPALTYSGATQHRKPEEYEILTRYSYPLSSAIRTTLIDPDTPPEAHTHKSRTGEDWVLTFSDEFNAEGRTFYDGDDQFFQAVDIHYDATKDLEWYDPDAVTTVNGTLKITFDAFKNHNLFYRSGMVHSWNKLCFTQGLITVSAVLPGYGHITGLWPGLWTMGNLGRPGYLASTEGVWPYTYDSCDAGITANQSSPDGISYLPGQKLNVCTCPGEEHPNTGVGRGAPEIDIVEGAMDTVIKVGVVSQSYQIAPMDIWYMPDYNFVEVYNSEFTTMNTYTGGPFQQAVSAVSTLNTTWYEFSPDGVRFQNYGYEYLNDDEEGYITWYVGKDPMFTVYANAMGPNGNVGHRRVSKEPMSIIMNLGMSNSWAYIDWPSITLPVHMSVDYLRVYQPEDEINMTCDPPDFPTADYIDSHKAAYYNVNHTSWESAGYKFPKNKIVNKC